VKKNGEEMKGLVVEEHADRVIVSTVDGEVPVMRTDIADIKYDTPEQNFMSIGKKYEADGKLGEALSYYEKASEANPDFEDAKKAAIAVRSRFWATETEGPRGEIERQQALQDGLKPNAASPSESQAAQLKDALGIVLEKKNDWVRIGNIDPKGKAAQAGLKKNDRLATVDGNSQRYLGLEAVRKNLLVPAYSNFILEFDRDVFIHKADDAALDLDAIGLKLKLEYAGLVVESVKEGGLADKAGIKEGDLLTHVNGAATRYLPYNKVVKLVRGTRGPKIAFTVRRSAHLTRG
jgi:predicted metalloprotease with PDZ domain